jgi:hypothetical protein
MIVLHINFIYLLLIIRTTFATVFTSGHLSSLSKTPSPSVSGKGQPAFSFGPATVGHLHLSATPSLSVSGHPSMQLNQIRRDKHHSHQQPTVGWTTV